MSVTKTHKKCTVNGTKYWAIITKNACTQK